MSTRTKIQWCDHTFNPWRGCRKVSTGCEHCYIVRTPPLRIRRQVHGAERVRPLEKTLALPFLWNKKPWICPRCGHTMTVEQSQFYRGCPTGKHANAHRRLRVFCLSLGDWLDDEVPIEWLADLLATIFACSDLDWLLLSKRLENFQQRLIRALDTVKVPPLPDWAAKTAAWITPGYPPPRHVWVGTSVENQATADKRIPLLADIPAAVRFLSCEPLLEPITLPHPLNFPVPEVDWVIVGGESGPFARPCHVQWIEKLIDQCAVNQVPIFVKQVGANAWSHPDGRNEPFEIPNRDRDYKGDDVRHWPEDLRVRQFPNAFALEEARKVQNALG